MFESMMECKRFELEGDSLRDSFASRTSKIFKAGDRRRLYKSEGEKVRSLLGVKGRSSLNLIFSTSV